jgi:hypothetical protein
LKLLGRAASEQSPRINPQQISQFLVMRFGLRLMFLFAFTLTIPVSGVFFAFLLAVMATAVASMAPFVPVFFVASVPVFVVASPVMTFDLSSMMGGAVVGRMMPAARGARGGVVTSFCKAQATGKTHGEGTSQNPDFAHLHHLLI